VVEVKIKAVSKHVSQLEPSIDKYRPDWDPKDLEKLVEYLKSRATRNRCERPWRGRCCGRPD
jgi:hypothetical protein